jgi:endo-1,4-beta-xylanase
MHFLSKLAFSVTGTVWLLSMVGCQDQPNGLTTGLGGSSAVSNGGSGGSSGAGGTTITPAQTGGTKGSGGVTSSGGSSTETGGAPATGGKPGSGGAMTAVDASADSKPANDGSLVGSDGRLKGTGGSTSAGGSTGAGGTPAAGGSTGSAGPVKKWFGNIDTRGSIRTDFSKMWDQFSPENAGKWGSVQGGGQSSFSWGSLDKMYKYCQDNNIVFKEHCFIWGSQQPSWVNSSNAEAAVKAWMKAFCERFPSVKVIDVVNEPLHPVPSYKEGIGGAGTSGWDWIVNALKWAKEACPNAILVVNDYNTIEYSNENGRIISLVNAVKKAGGPIDAVGCQSHDIAKVSQATMTSYGQKIIDQTGLPLHITEMDIGISDDNQQLQKMKDFVTWAWENDKINGVTYWGYIVGATWRDGTGLMTDSGSKRPALTWLLDYLKR